MKRMFFFICCSVCLNIGYAQEVVDIFTINKFDKQIVKNQEALAITKDLKAFSVLTIEDFSTTHAKFKRSKESILHLQLPVNDTETISLKLAHQNIYADNFRVVEQSEKGSKVVPFKKPLHFTGTVQGQSSSLVGLTISEEELMGVISYKGSSYNLELYEEKNGVQSYLLYRQEDYKHPLNLDCATDEFKSMPAELDRSAYNNSRSSASPIEVYLECDYHMYRDNNNTNATARYATNLFNMVAGIFRTSADVTLNISEIKVWSSPDPYRISPYESGSTSFDNFINNTQSFNGHIAHLLSTSSVSGFGGIAELGFCEDVGKNYSFSAALNNSYNSYLSIYSWDISVMAHELGHNLGSTHTFSCAWNGNNTPIDCCGYNAEYQDCGCRAGIPSRGTIMSYCDNIDLSQGFHPQVAAAIYQVSSCIEQGRDGGNNSTFCNATEITCGNTYSGSTTSSTYNNPNNLFQHCGSGGLGAPNIFYKYRGNNGEVTIALCNSNFDTRIDVYRIPANSCSNSSRFTCITGNDDDCELQSAVSFYADAQYDYFIMIHGYVYEGTPAVGNYSLTLSCSNNTISCACTNQFHDNICEDFESYSIYQPLGPQSDCWIPWNGSDGSYQDLYVASIGNSQALHVSGTSVDGGPQDIVLQLGDKTTGVYDLEFSMLIHYGKRAYYNIQHQFQPEQIAEWASNVHFDGYGGGTLEIQGNSYPFSYQTGQWIRIKQRIDLSQDFTSLYINNSLVVSWPFSSQATSTTGGLKQLSAINFYPINNTYNFYVDDIQLTKSSNTQAITPPTVTEESAIEIFPNPVSDLLNINLVGLTGETIELHFVTVTGKIIHQQVVVNNGSVQIDVSEIPDGIYIIQASDIEGVQVAEKIVVK